MPKITVHGGPSNKDLPEEVPQSESEAPLVRPEGDYSTWSYRDLLAEARLRELPRTGTAQELAARLHDDDEV